MGAQPRGELVRYDAKSSHFVPYLSGISAEHLNFSRDGQWISYVDYPGASLWRSNLDGSHRLQLSFPPMQASLPRWSPDGKRILFIGLAPGKIWKMYTVSAEGGTPEQLLPGERQEVDPDWSPDGSSVVFGRNPWFESGAFGPVTINLLNLNTREVTTLPGSEGLWAPVWSHDGRYITAVGGGSKKLLLFDFATQRWMELVNSPLDYFSWARDGKHIYFDNPSGSDPAIFRVGISERVVSLKNINLVSGIWQQWFGLAPDDSPLVLRSAGSQEIYALDWEAP